MFLPAAHASVLHHHAVARGFFYSGLMVLILAALVAVATAHGRARATPRGALAALVGAFFLLPAVFALPFHQARPETPLFDAWFEMVSCFTTTGATLYEGPGALAPSLHLWRALVGWFGGAFILVAGAAILAPLDLGGMEVATGRVPGRGGISRTARGAEPGERLTRHAAIILPAYTLLTVGLWLLLLVAGEEGLMAMTIALSTLSTSGILPGVPLRAAESGLLAEVFIFLFLLPALTRRSLPGTAHADRGLALWRDHEVKVAAVLLLLVPVVLLLRHWIAAIALDNDTGGATLAGAFWGGMFTALSFLTTTGFESASWDTARLWSGIPAPGLILVGLAMCGGGIATAAGGLKLLRLYALFRHGEHELHRIVHPNSVSGGGAVARRLAGEGAYAAWVFFMLFAVTLAAVIAALSLSGADFENAMILAVAAVTTTGPLASVAAEAPIRYSELETVVKAILAGAMIAGRIEVLALFALFAPSAWRR